MTRNLIGAILVAALIGCGSSPANNPNPDGLIGTDAEPGTDGIAVETSPDLGKPAGDSGSDNGSSLPGDGGGQGDGGGGPVIKPDSQTIVLLAQNFSQAKTPAADQPAWTKHGSDEILAYLKGSDGEAMGDGSNYVVYDLKLPAAGTYYLYFEGRVGTAADGVLGSTGVNDSFYIPAKLDGQTPTVKMDGFTCDFKSANSNCYLTSSPRYYKTTQQYQVSDISTSHQLALGVRQDGMIISKVVLSLRSDLLSN